MKRSRASHRRGVASPPDTQHGAAKRGPGALTPGPFSIRPRVQPPVLSFRSSIRGWLASSGIVAAHLLDEALGILAPDERLDGVSERKVGSQCVIDDGIEDHTATC